MKVFRVKPEEQRKNLELKCQMNKSSNKKITKIVNYCRRNSQCIVDIRYNEPMAEFTTFKVGGSADCWLSPYGDDFPQFSASLLCSARTAGIPVFILGGGANIVVSDNGIRGIVLDTSQWKGKTITEEGIIFRSGTSIDEAVDCAVGDCLSGMEFLAGMPGTIGGAVYMNARCYGKEIIDTLVWTEILDFTECAQGGIPEIKRVAANKEDFGYKRSPFQKKDCLILSSCFRLQHGNKKSILDEMKKNRHDRKEKGHYLFPCAGSAFKNNRNFGKPTGQIIDELGMKGFSVGGAQIAPFHGNIVINTGGATSAEISALMNKVSEKVKTATGFVLEPEILFVGEYKA
jgi:UDP-N-acetylmuramate dehydrogenase